MNGRRNIFTGGKIWCGGDDYVKSLIFSRLFHFHVKLAPNHKIGTGIVWMMLVVKQHIYSTASAFVQITNAKSQSKFKQVSSTVSRGQVINLSSHFL